MKSSRHIEGATLIGTVLLLAVLLVVLFSLTATVAISSRRVTVDQRVALQAQYSAESGIARAQARMAMARDLLTSLTFDAKTEPRDLEGMLHGLCGGGGWRADNLAQPVNDPQAGLSLCDNFNQNEAASRNKLVSLLVSRIKSESYQAYGITNRPAFWNALLDGAAVTSVRTNRRGGQSRYASSVGLRFTNIARTGPGAYRLEYVFTDVTSNGKYTTDGGGTLASSRVVLAQRGSGKHTLTFASPSFAQWALFTNNHSGNIWFTDNTLFGGPVHTNQNFNFFRNPWFGGQVTSAGCQQVSNNQCQGNVRAGANFYFYNPTTKRMEQQFLAPGEMGNNPAEPSVGADPGVAAPRFSAGVNWNAPFVPLPTGFENCRDGSATCGQTQRVSEQEYEAGQAGLLFGDLYSLTLSRGADGKQYIKTQMSSDANNVVEYRYGPDNRMEMRRSNGEWQRAYKVPYSPTAVDKTYGAFAGQWVTESEAKAAPGLANFIGDSDSFNGVVFSTGKVERLTGPARSSVGSPAITKFAQLTVAAKGDIRVTGDLTYESPPCSGSNTRGAGGAVTAAPCGDLNARNVLGIYAIGGDVRIGNQNQDPTLNAPNDLSLHASVMSASGSVTVENYNTGSPRGAVNLIGGLIQNTYGAFGTFNGTGQGNATGYSRNFVYDQRLGAGVRPPKFPRPETPWTPNPDNNPTGGIWQRVGQ